MADEPNTVLSTGGETTAGVWIKRGKSWDPVIIRQLWRAIS